MPTSSVLPGSLTPKLGLLGTAAEAEVAAAAAARAEPGGAAKAEAEVGTETIAKVVTTVLGIPVMVVVIGMVA